MTNNTENYNDEPVYYCAKCLSLRILTDETTGDYCPDCGSTDIQQAHITVWEKLYKELHSSKH